jgi:peptidoglycan/xylan/chitin deacetylase (PgdA/CDA1 family)
MTIKAVVRNGIAGLLFRTGMTHPQRRAAGHLAIVTFHRVLPSADRNNYPYPGLVVTPDELSELLAFFKQHFDCGTLATQHERYCRGERPERPMLAVTFDDAQYDNFLYAQPVLSRFGVLASFFVPVSAVLDQTLLWHDQLGFGLLDLQRQGKDGEKQLQDILAAAGLAEGPLNDAVENVVQRAKQLDLEARLRLVSAITAAAGNTCPPEFARMMNFAELAILATEGHEIGSHSMTHCLMPECSDQALEYEVAESRSVLQTRLGLPVDSFCFPNGNSDARTAAAVADAGYQRAVTTVWGHNSPDANPYRLRRCDMDTGRICDAKGRLLPAVLAFRMSGLHPYL